MGKEHLHYLRLNDCRMEKYISSYVWFYWPQCDLVIPEERSHSSQQCLCSASLGQGEIHPGGAHTPNNHSCFLLLDPCAAVILAFPNQ